MKHLLVSLAALCLVGCSSSGFTGRWEETPVTGRSVLQIDDDGTFAAGAMPEGEGAGADADVRWELTGTWAKLSSTRITLARRDGEIDTAKLVEPDTLLFQSPGTAMTTFQRRRR